MTDDRIDVRRKGAAQQFLVTIDDLEKRLKELEKQIQKK